MFKCEVLRGVKLKELAKQYRAAEDEITERIAQIKLLPQDAITKIRLKDLTSIRKEVRAIAKLCETYYDKGVWRSEKFTFNVRTARRYPAVCKLGAGRCGVKYTKNRADETESKGCNRIGVDSTTEASSLDCALERLFSNQNRPRVGGEQVHNKSDHEQGD